jgi:uncharacterized protein (DUF1778 family)
MFEEPERPTPRTALLALRVTSDERRLVQAAASQAGISVARLMRRALAREMAAERGEEPVAA